MRILIIIKFIFWVEVVLAGSQRAEPSNMLMNLSDNEMISEHELIKHSFMHSHK